ncbi:hypothetical protein KKB18_11065, partial [bacterium]|nr:hypothetical protein [bacterium]
MQISSRKALSFFGMLFLSLGIIIFSASDSFCQNHTVINSDITADTTWNLSGSPYVITNEIVLYEINPNTNKPVVLKIIGQSNNPVIIKIAPNVDIYFNGIVEANNVIFTSLNDDFGFAYYGSTGNPLPGDWDGIHLSNIKSIFRGTSFRYGDYVECIGSAVDEFFNCDFENLSRYGIFCLSTATEDCYPRIRNCDFVNIGEPFIDNNGNGKWDTGENYYDYNTNGGYDEGIAIMMT